MEDLFQSKNECVIYIPLTIKNTELFIVELLDICDSFLDPLKYGVSKEDIIDYIVNNSNVSLQQFLIRKRYVSPIMEFVNIVFRHGLTEPDGTIICKKILFENINYNEIEKYFMENSLEEIINNKDNEIGKLSKGGLFTHNE